MFFTVVARGANRITIYIREHLLVEFKMISLLRLKQNGVNVYVSPPYTCVAGWVELILSNLKPQFHDLVLARIRHDLEFFDNIRKGKLKNLYCYF